MRVSELIPWIVGCPHLDSLGIGSGTASAANAVDSIPPPPKRAEGDGPFHATGVARRDDHRRHGCASVRPGGRGGRGQPDREREDRRRARFADRSQGSPQGGARGQGVRPHRHVPAARTGGSARAHRRDRAGHAGGVRLQAVARPRGHHGPRSRQRQRHRLGGRAQAAERAQRDHRAAPGRLRVLRPGSRGALHRSRRRALLGARHEEEGRRRRQVLRLPARRLRGRGARGRQAREWAPPATTPSWRWRGWTSSTPRVGA